MTGQPTLRSPSDTDGRRRSLRNEFRAGVAWLAALLVIFLWWASGYRALVERLGEWQFSHFGEYYPSLTVGIIVIGLALPVALVVAWQHRRYWRADRDVTGAPLAMLRRALRSADRSRVVFLTLAVLTALIAIGVFMSILWLPSDSGSVRSITGIEGSVQPEGAAAYARPLRLGRVARLVENVGVAQRVLYVAPVYLSHKPDEGGFLTVVDPIPGPPLRFAAISSGVLVERGLPRELINLYRAAGVPVSDRSYLLMRDGASVRWRSLILGIQVALLSLVAGGVSLIFRRQAKRLRRVMRESGSLRAP